MKSLEMEEEGGAKQKKGSSSSTVFLMQATVIIAALVVSVLAIVLLIKGVDIKCEEGGTTNAPVTSSEHRQNQSDTEKEGKKDPYQYIAQEQVFRYGAIATGNRKCAIIGNDVIVKHGGSAVDGAIATTFCNGVLNYHLSGVGGGFIMTIHDKKFNGSSNNMYSIIAREVAPLSANHTMYSDDFDASVLGGRSIGVPGEVMGLYRAWQKFGRVSEWATLVEPSIKICLEGVPVTETIHKSFSLYKHKVADLLQFQDLFKMGERYFAVGDKIKNIKLAGTLQKIADDPMSFYEGDLADDIVKDIQDAGGEIVLQDLKNYRIDEDKLSYLKLNNGNFHTYSAKPPAGGTAFQYILNILDSFNITHEDYSNPSLLKHRMIEAFKYSFAKRSSFGDGSFVNISGAVDDMLSSDYGKTIRQKINDEKTYPSSHYQAAYKSTKDAGTAHISVMAPDGSAVSLTSTINYYWGSKVRGSRTGIIFNNQMSDFSIPASDGENVHNKLAENVNNYPEPGKRPLSSTCPTIVLDEDHNVRMIVGGAGGPKIPTASAQVLVNHLWLNLPLWKATSLPRVHHSLYPEETLYETGMCSHQVEALRQKGHNLVNATHIAAINSIGVKCPEGKQGYHCIEATTDPRRLSEADGY